MFGSKVKAKVGDTDATAVMDSINVSGTSCIIGKGTTIEGKFYTPQDLRLDGQIEGNVVCDKKLVMGANGLIKGKTSCNNSSIEGKIDGEILVNGTLHLSKTASVDGTIRAKKLMVDEGASYSGECLIGEKHFK